MGQQQHMVTEIIMHWHEDPAPMEEQPVRPPTHSAAAAAVTADTTSFLDWFFVCMM